MNRYLTVFVDDNDEFLYSIARSLPEKITGLCSEFSCHFEYASSYDELIDIIGAMQGDMKLAMLVSDQILSGITGLNLIEKVKKDHPDTICMLLTGQERMDSAIHAMNSKVLDQYVLKPIEDQYMFASMLANLLKRYHGDIEERNRTEQLAATVVQLRGANEMISSMYAASDQIARLANDLLNMECDDVIATACNKLALLFRAKKCELCMLPTKCPLAKAGNDALGVDGNDIIIECDWTWKACGKLGDMSPEIIIPIKVRGGSTSQLDGKDQRGYLCISHVAQDEKASGELLRYKASLVRDIISTSMSNAKLFQRTKTDSETDYLTGAYTRRYLSNAMDSEYERALRYKHRFCVVIVDVDYFKRVNDQYGHLFGDKMLQMLVDMLNLEKRSTDLLARYGGDEFAILMPETNLAEAIQTAERMRRYVESNLVHEGHALTISCGVAEWSGKGQELADVIRRADMALYRAKQANRNCVQTTETAMNSV